MDHQTDGSSGWLEMVIQVSEIKYPSLFLMIFVLGFSDFLFFIFLVEFGKW